MRHNESTPYPFVTQPVVDAVPSIDDETDVIWVGAVSCVRPSSTPYSLLLTP